MGGDRIGWPVEQEQVHAVGVIGKFGKELDFSDKSFTLLDPAGNLYSMAPPSALVNEIDLLAVGDILLLYTDGLTEYADGSYFPERLERLLSEVRDRPAAEISNCIEEDLARHGEPCDDVSVVVIRKTA